MTDAPTPSPSSPVSGRPAAPPVASPPSRWPWWLLAATLVAVAAGGTLWHRRVEAERAQAAQTLARLDAVISRVDGLRRDVRSHGQRLQQADSTNRVLRDELLGLGQRAVLLEDQVTRLADANRHGAQQLRMDEVELLLTLGRQRLDLAADLDGARRAYALAAGVLDGIENPGLLNLRQALAQERAALEALGADPRQVALQRLDALAAALPEVGATPQLDAPAPGAPWWERALSRLVRVRPTTSEAVIAGNDRDAGETALQLELTLARAAIERRDIDGYRAALTRAEAWLQRLWPASPRRTALQTRFAALRALPLTADVPTLGSTLSLLQAQH